VVPLSKNPFLRVEIYIFESLIVSVAFILHLYKILRHLSGSSIITNRTRNKADLVSTQTFYILEGTEQS